MPCAAFVTVLLALALGGAVHLPRLLLGRACAIDVLARFLGGA